MKDCKKFQQWIWLDLYGELTPGEKQELENHLVLCTNCRLYKQEANETVNTLNRKMQLAPTALELETNRSELHQRLLIVKQSQLKKQGWLKIWSNIWHFISLEFAPGYRFATAVVLLLIGVFCGRFFLTPAQSIQPEEITTEKTNISGVEYVKYHPHTKKVSIKLNVVNEMMVEGNVEDPKIQMVLAQALATSDRPNVRLKTVAALYGADSLSRPTQRVLTEVLQTDKNPGIRLKAVKLLNTLPLDTQVKELLINSFIKVLMNEENPAIRNEAADGLTRFEDEDFGPLISSVARGDSNDYLKYKALKLQRKKLQRNKNEF